MRLYVNGVEVANRAQGGAIHVSNGSLSVGGDLAGVYFAGVIDEVRVYDRALSAAAIQVDLATPVGTGGPHAPEHLRIVP